MKETMISVLTPSFNSGEYLERAIISVLDQDYSNWEHIVVDGGSTDNTLDVLRKYDHLKWVSEKDKGQSDAMNKAFEMASGELIVYLNSDDEIAPGAFDSVITNFEPGMDMVIGNLKQVFSDGKIRIQENAKIKANASDIALYWKPFPFNPVCYYYRRRLQEKIGPFPIDEHYVMDYWFLLRALTIARVGYIDTILGVFYMHDTNKTSNEDPVPHLKRTSKSFLTEFNSKLIEKLDQFNSPPQTRNQNRILKRINRKLRAISSRAYWEHRDTLVLVYTMGKVGGTSLSYEISKLYKYGKVIHLHYLSEKWLDEARKWRAEPDNVWINRAREAMIAISKNRKVKIISVIRDPVALHISGEFETSHTYGDNLPNVNEEQIINTIKKKDFHYPSVWFCDELAKFMKIEMDEVPSFAGKDFVRMKKGNKSLLLLKFGRFGPGTIKEISQFLKIDLKGLSRRNSTANKPTNELYETVKSRFQLPTTELDEIYSQTLIRKAYSNAEIDEFKSKWSK